MAKNHDKDFAHKTLNLKSLEETLEKEIEAEKLYWLQNDAKLRAVKQGTATYDDFRQIVLGAHLQPMKKEDLKDFHKKVGSSKVVWNNNAATLSSSPGSSRPVHESNPSKSMDHLPTIRTSSDLLKTWKILRDNRDKQWALLRYLMRIDSTCKDSKRTWTEACHLNESERSMPNNTLGRLWREEVPFDMFTECLDFLMSQCSRDAKFFDENWTDVVQLLHEISRSQRFKLLMSFSSPSDNQNLTSIMKTLECTAEAKDLGLLQQIRQDLLAHTS